MDDPNNLTWHQAELPAVLRGYVEHLNKRFPAEAACGPTETVLDQLRLVLRAAGGDPATVLQWAEAIRDTDDAKTARAAIEARGEWRLLQAEAVKKARREAEQRHSYIELLKTAVALNRTRRRGRPNTSKYRRIDQEIAALATAYLHQHIPVMAAIRAAVNERWGLELCRLGDRAAVARLLGISQEAVTKRIFSALRQRGPESQADQWPFAVLALHVSSRRSRTVG